MKRIIQIILPVFLLSVISACGGDSGSDSVSAAAQPTTTVVDAAVDAGNFTTLVAALEATGLDEALADPDASYTVFAPTDAAFAMLGEETINALLADPDMLSAILLYHVVDGQVDAAAAVGAAGTTVATLNGASVGLSLSGDDLLVNTATVITTDIMTDNGIIHVIDAVLLPPAEMGEPTANIVDTAVAAGSFTTLVAALQATGLDSVLADESQSFTVFAPTDDAFALIGADTINALLADTDALSAVLLQHVISGAAVDSTTAYSLNGSMPATASGAEIKLMIDPYSDMLMFGAANIVMKDIYTTNGVIHVIDAVILADAELPAPAASIVDVAVSAGSFNTLAAALQATGLDTVLADLDGSFTVFAPTDAAFAKLPDGTVEALLNDTDALSSILLYHVVGGEVLSDAAIGVARSMENQVMTVNGSNAALSFVDSSLYVNGAMVSAANITAANGVIHVIDNVILPPMMNEPTGTIVDVALADENFSTLVAALSAANLVDVLADEGAMFTVFAPTNDAFAMIDPDVLDQLLGDTDALTAVLLQHVVADASLSSVDAYAANGKMVETASGAKIGVSVMADTGMLMFGGANIVMKDIYTTNGVIHVIDAVVTGDLELPEPRMSLVDVAVANGNFTTLVAALQATGLDAVLADLDSSYTVFAPTDEAFAKLPDGTVEALLADTDALSNILLYHVLAGSVDSTTAVSVATSMSNQVEAANMSNLALSSMDGMLYVNGAMVTAPDVMSDNGIIHVVDTVIVPPEMTDMMDKTIAEIVIADSNFSTLLAAVSAAGLADALNDESATFTVFAPTNDAFDALPAGTVEALLADIPALTDILELHVVNGAALSATDAYAANGMMVETLGGETVDIGIDMDSRMITVSGAKVIVTNIYAKNGVIHVIDAVITE
ncbi:fasciclin domain-containing protein [Thalassotalea sp. HSM 43]|uniref:fasciclin domain-containing protein n=1 Tax=Thalassotalea sp. HSM 43 TaxID=2552945 RepID=UPI001080BB8E|nr:fasciclin domain-containing protein [Thalassotalea sp. HSM 43]QBY03662.1 fasciclin domain-containing protein [Thalassotalea sp. HSM 43]